MPEPIDVAILVALEEEFDELLDLVGKTESEPDGVYGGTYFTFAVAGPTGEPYRCATKLIGNMGPDAAAPPALGLLDKWQPETAIMLGIAAGLSDDVSLGDVVVASQIDAYASNLKAAQSAGGGFEFEHRGSVYAGPHDLLEVVKDLKYVHRDAYSAWQAECAGEREKLIPKNLPDGLGERIAAEPRVRRIHLASGPVLGASVDFVKWLQGRDGTIGGLEMEGAALVAAAHKRKDPVRTLVIRGVSDFGDERKKLLDTGSKGGVRRYAARNATRLMLLLAKAGVFPRNPNATTTKKVPILGPRAPSRPATASAPREARPAPAAAVSVPLGTADEPEDDGDSTETFKVLCKSVRALLKPLGLPTVSAIYASINRRSWSPDRDEFDSYESAIKTRVEGGYLEFNEDDGTYTPNAAHPKVKKALASIEALEKFMGSAAAEAALTQVAEEEELIVELSNREFFDRFCNPFPTLL